VADFFVSYRREDEPGHAGRLYDHLVAKFGDDHVFMDVDRLAPGADFVEQLDAALKQAAALIVVIGPRWVEARDRQGRRRLDAADDYVRREIVAALEHQVAVFPVLVRGGVMPSANDLPDSIAPMARRQALELSDLRWATDVRRLMAALSEVARQRVTSTADRSRVRTLTPTRRKRVPRPSSVGSSRSVRRTESPQGGTRSGPGAAKLTSRSAIIAVSAVVTAALGVGGGAAAAGIEFDPEGLALSYALVGAASALALAYVVIAAGRTRWHAATVLAVALVGGATAAGAMPLAFRSSSFTLWAGYGAVIATVSLVPVEDWRVVSAGAAVAGILAGVVGLALYDASTHELARSELPASWPLEFAAPVAITGVAIGSVIATSPRRR
jgi:hypothetical protein